MLENIIGAQLKTGRSLKILDYFVLLVLVGGAVVGGALVGGGGAMGAP